MLDKEQDAAAPTEPAAAERDKLAEDVVPEAEAGHSAGAAVAEPLDQAVARLERQAEEWKDRALRAAADLDNYRRRAVRERDEALHRGAADVLVRIADVIDDLGRVAHLDPEATSAQALHEGMLQIERKFLKLLESVGLERVDPAGQPFDPNAHEAVTTLPAPAAEQDHTIGVVYQPGYRYRGALLRAARVAVYQWSGPPAEPAGPAA